MSAADLEIAIRKTVAEINAAAISRASRGLNILRNLALEVLSQNGSGRRYGRHIASSPGQPPAPDKGNLRRNWQGQKLVTSNGSGVRIVLKIKSKMFYADFLEHGTRKMAPRPYRERIKKKAKPQITALFSEI